MYPIRAAYLALLTCLLGLANGASADRLTAQGLVLIVNRNEPAGRELAEYYRAARGVPEDRILELDLPLVDTLPRAAFAEKVLAPTRAFIDARGGRGTIRCAVTFFGVPLRVGKLEPDADDRREQAEIERWASEVVDRMEPTVRAAEEVTRSIGQTAQTTRTPVTAPAMARLRGLLGRLAAVEAHVQSRLPTLDNADRQRLTAAIPPIREALARPLEPRGAQAPPSQINDLLARPDRAARAELRNLLRGGASVQDLAVVLLRQSDALDADQSDACLDSELAGVWLSNLPAARWIPNPLAAAEPSDQHPAVLMTARLDGVNPQRVRDLIANSLLAERDGLSGMIVVDSRGIPPVKPDGAPDSYGAFDEHLRDLARFLSAQAKLAVVHDDRPEVIREPVVEDVAVYAGWYSLRNYAPGMSFVRGAVGYHVASFEMLALRGPERNGWVAGLLDNGVEATLGPVAEPYLAAFPPPGRFVPLLLTGELTLAEVYWRTVPMLSWQMGLIGDPLYRPFAAGPALHPASLPANLRRATVP